MIAIYRVVLVIGGACAFGLVLCAVATVIPDSWLGWLDDKLFGRREGWQTFDD